MSQVFVSSGQSFNGATVGPNDFVQVLSGGVALGDTVAGGQLQILAGGSASGTTVGSGFLLVTGGTAASTSVGSGGYDIVAGGVDTGTSIGSGGFLIVNSGGTATDPVVSSGGYLLLSSGTIDGATLLSGTQLAVPGGSVAAGTSIQPSASLDLETLPYSAGDTLSFSSATDLLTINQRAQSAAVQLGGSYAGDDFTLSDDGGGNPPGSRANGTLVTVQTSGGFADTAHNTTITGAIPDAANILGYARYLLTSAGVSGPGPGDYTTVLDQLGDQAIYSTPGTPGGTLTVSGTGQSVVAAGSGNNVVNVSNGTHLIATGLGANTVNLASGYNTLDSEGNDAVLVGTGGDTISITGQTVITGGSATLSVFLYPTGQLTLYTGTGSVKVQGGFGSGAFSGGTDGNNLLVAGTGPTTLYAGGAGDVLVASGGSTTAMNGYGGAETMVGQYSQGTDTFNFNGANVFATGGAGQNIFNIGAGTNNIVAGAGRDVFNFTNGAAGSTYISDFDVTRDQVHLAGYAAGEAATALTGAVIFGNSEILHLRDGTTIGFGGVTGLTASSFV